MNNSSILIEEVGRSVELVLQYKANISTDAQYVPMPIVYRHISINKLYQCATKITLYTPGSTNDENSGS